MKNELYNLIIEVTRRCNMGCAHCLRGDAQNIDIDVSYIDSILKDTDYISVLTFSGGEPSLNLAAIDYTLKRCQELNIRVGSFYIVTNGKSNVLPLTMSALKWYSYCEEKDMCGLSLSKDIFHDDIDSENESLLRGLSFFTEDKFNDFDRVSLVYSGRAEELGWDHYTDVDSHNEELDVEYYNDIRSINSMIYLSANGDIRTNCDTAYDDTEYVIGNLNENNFSDIIENYITATNESAA